jgi:hypothetical protein
MRTFDLAATFLHEDFEGYRDLTELLETWSEVDTSGIATLSLEFDPYSVGGQRQHPRFTIDNTSGSVATVRLQSVDIFGHAYWLPGKSVSGECEIVARYRCSAGLVGATATAFARNSIISGSASSVVTADDQWHEIRGDYSVFTQSIFASGLRFELSGIPAGASGTVDFDEFRIYRREQIDYAINSACPVAPLRADWAEGYRETITFPTHVTRSRNGTEHRSLLRIVPRWRVEYMTIAADPVEAARIDAWLWEHLDQRVAVPRWQDALHFESIEQSNTWIWLAGGSTTDRWFWPEQRVMLWRAPDDYEAVQIWQVGADYVRLDVNVNQVQGTWDTSTLVVPLVPGRLIETVELRRPNGRTSAVPLAFELDMVAATF